MSTGQVTSVMVHGVGLDRTMWSEVIARLPQSVIAYDLLGHGWSPALPDGSNLSTLVDQLLEISDTANVPIDLVGFSLGALVAQAFTLHHPERVRRLVLLNSVFDRTAIERTAILSQVADVRNGGYLANVAAALDRWFSAEFTAARPDVVAAVRERMLDNDVASYANAYEIFATADKELTTELHRITQPTLVLAGEHDKRSTPAMARALADTVANGHAIVIHGARHVTPLEKPDLVAACINDFLEESDA